MIFKGTNLNDDTYIVKMHQYQAVTGYLTL